MFASPVQSLRPAAMVPSLKRTSRGRFSRDFRSGNVLEIFWKWFGNGLEMRRKSDFGVSIVMQLVVNKDYFSGYPLVPNARWSNARFLLVVGL